MNFTFRQPYNSLDVFWKNYGFETAMDLNMFSLVSTENKINKYVQIIRHERPY